MARFDKCSRCQGWTGGGRCAQPATPASASPEISHNLNRRGKNRMRSFYHGRARGRARGLRGFDEEPLRGPAAVYLYIYIAQSTQTLHSSEQGAVALLPIPRSHCSPSASSTMPSPQKCGNWQPGAQPFMVP